MSLLGLAAVGFLLGVRHAFDADHLAAVASLSTRTRSVGEGLRLGALWGFGHTTTLFVLGSLVLLLDIVVPERLASGLELAVGVMLLFLGGDVLLRGIRRRIHWHTHRHDDGTVHSHAHAHRASDEAGQSRGRDEHPESEVEAHVHRHPPRSGRRALLVGLMHGMAGSAALILLTLDAAPGFGRALMYMLLFGLGSMAGMALLTAAIVVPVRYSGRLRSLAGLHRGLEVVLGLVTIGIGVAIILESWGPLEVFR